MNPATIVRAAATTLAGLATLEYVGVLASLGWDLTVSPFGLLLFLVVPQVTGLLLMSRRSRAGIAVVGVDCLAWAAVTGFHLLSNLGEAPGQWGWTTYLMIYLGAPIGLIGVVASIAAFRTATVAVSVDHLTRKGAWVVRRKQRAGTQRPDRA